MNSTVGLQHDVYPLDNAQPKGPVEQGRRSGGRVRRSGHGLWRAGARAGELRGAGCGGPGGRLGGRGVLRAAEEVTAWSRFV